VQTDCFIRTTSLIAIFAEDHRFININNKMCYYLCTMSETAITEAIIPGKLTVEQAASGLSVSRHQVTELIHNGSLSATRTAGGAFLISAKSLEQLKITRCGNGRPLKQETAWAALWALSGLDVPWLNYHQKRRLSIRLKKTTVQDLVWDTRRRARTLWVRISDSFLGDARKHLVLSGMSAVREHGFNLVGESSYLEGYIAQRELWEFIKRYHALEGEDANVMLHVTLGVPIDLKSLTVMPVAVVATDLSASLDVRERKAGLERLEELLNARTSGQNT
jgi:excisionase family DNA binding protein